MHEMELIDTKESGEEEWLCPECGRRFLMKWKPYDRTILEYGDESVSHTGTKGGMRISVNAERDSGLSTEMENALEELDFGETE